MIRRNIIIGIDGIPFELMDNLSDKGIMPNFQDLKREFTFKEMKSSIPHISSVSWSSIITGENPGEHGIYGFTDMIENTYSLRYPNYNALKSKPFWYFHPDRSSVILNVPSTYPAKELNGIHISGFVALDLEKATYPKKYVPILKDLNYEIDVDTKLAHQQSKDVFIDELFRVLKIRRKTFDYFWETIKWKNFMPVITSSDRFGHFMWNAYENSKNPYHNRILEFFNEIDNIIGDIKGRIEEDDTLIILSDHGMEGVESNVNLNTYLEKEGLLNLSSNLKNYNRIQKDSKGFVLDPGRIYLNKKGRYPNGMIIKEQEQDTVEELKILFNDLKYNNRKVIKKIYEKEEIYSGKMLINAPDLVLIENKGFQLKASIGKADIFEQASSFSGKHSDSAFICINKDIELENPTVTDVIGLLG